MKKYTAQTTIKHNGVSYNKGDVMELEEKDAEVLLENGSLSATHGKEPMQMSEGAQGKNVISKNNKK